MLILNNFFFGGELHWFTVLSFSTPKLNVFTVAGGFPVSSKRPAEVDLPWLCEEFKLRNVAGILGTLHLALLLATEQLQCLCTSDVKV